MADSVKEGDKVSWHWNGNKPSGTVAEVKNNEVSVTSHRGNVIKRTGDEEDPAVHIERPGNDVVKNASGLNIEQNSLGGDMMDKEGEEKHVEEQNGGAEEKEEEGKVGEKRKVNEKGEQKEEEMEVKKQKTDDDISPEAKNRPGRPKANGEKKPATKKEKKVLAVGKSERKTRSQGAA